MIRRRTITDILVLVLFAFAGGVSVNSFLMKQGHAQSTFLSQGSFRPSANIFYAGDRLNPKGVIMYVDDAAPGIVFNSLGGGVRLQSGLYPFSAADRQRAPDLPYIEMSDRKGTARMLLKLNGRGSNNAPEIVMMDSKGKRRLIIGTALSDPAEEGFLTLYDRNGRPSNVFDRIRRSLYEKERAQQQQNDGFLKYQ